MYLIHSTTYLSSKIMKDVLLDIVSHTHALGFLDLIKINAEDPDTTTIESMAEDRSVILFAETHEPVPDFKGMFGMPNLEKLTLHLKNPEYENNGHIEVIETERNGESIPTHIHFQNENGDFQNDYRFMSRQIIEEKLKSVKFKGSKWTVEFNPTVDSIRRMKLMSAAHSEETIFTVKTVETEGVVDLVFYFGDPSTHAGNFVFQTDVGNKLKHSWSWPVSQVQSILRLSGDLKMSISDQGAMKITVDSGLAVYDFILPAQTK